MTIPLGDGLLSERGTITVTYQVKGAEEQIINSFTVSGGQVTGDSIGRTKIKKSNDTLTAEVTGVTYAP